MPQREINEQRLPLVTCQIAFWRIEQVLKNQTFDCSGRSNHSLIDNDDRSKDETHWIFNAFQLDRPDFRRVTNLNNAEQISVQQIRRGRVSIDEQDIPVA